MKRKFAVAVVFCVVIAAFCIGAAPAVAADGCDCHTVEPLTAPTPHAPYVAAVADCTTCHVGWTVPHPVATVPALTARHVTPGGLGMPAVTGGLCLPWVPLAGVTVYPQIMKAGETDWTTLGSMTTDAKGMWARGPVLVPDDVRAISVGVDATPVVMPAVSGPFKRPIPPLTLRLKGLTRHILARGHAVTATGKGLPTELAGQKVIVRLLKRRFFYRSQAGIVHWVWDSKRVKMAKISLAGDYSTKFTVRYRGVYRVRAIIEGTAAYRTVRTDYRTFRVR